MKNKQDLIDSIASTMPSDATAEVFRSLPRFRIHWWWKLLTYSFLLRILDSMLSSKTVIRWQGSERSDVSCIWCIRHSPPWKIFSVNLLKNQKTLKTYSIFLPNLGHRHCFSSLFSVCGIISPKRVSSPLTPVKASVNLLKNQKTLKTYSIFLPNLGHNNPEIS